MDKTQYEEGCFYGLNHNIMLKQKMPNKYGLFICPTCGAEFKCIRSQIRKRIGCKACTNNNKLKVHVGDKFAKLTVLEILDKKNADNRRICMVQCSCNNNTVFYTNTHHLLTGNTKSCGCMQKEKVIEMNKQRVLDISGQRFGRLVAVRDTGESSSQGHVWLFDCDCGKKNIPIRLGDVRRFSRIGVQSCGCLKSSKGELAIEKALNELGITYFKEYVFKDCINPKTGQKLRYDFFLSEFNICIEFDGIQYFTKAEYRTDYWWGQVNLKDIQYRDKIKDDYCRDKDIHLIRISYTELMNISSVYLKERIDDANIQ